MKSPANASMKLAIGIFAIPVLENKPLSHQWIVKKTENITPYKIAAPGVTIIMLIGVRSPLSGRTLST